LSLEKLVLTNATKTTALGECRPQPGRIWLKNQDVDDFQDLLGEFLFQR